MQTQQKIEKTKKETQTSPQRSGVCQKVGCGKIGPLYPKEVTWGYSKATVMVCDYHQYH